MESNVHAAVAESMLAEAPPSRDGLDGVIHMLEANAEATLALAKAQETANLIAVLAEYGPDLHSRTDKIHDAYKGLTEELRRRYGL